MKHLLLKTMLLLCALVVGSNGTMLADDIATWGKVSFAANTGVTASGGDTNNKGIATITSNKAITTSGAANAYYGSSAGGAQIIISSLSLSEYSGISMTFYTRASKGGNIQVSTSENGTDYSDLTSVSVSSSEGIKTINSIPSSAQYIKLKHSASTGSFYFGTITISGTKSIVTTNLSITTPPAKVKYKIGDALDLSGLVLDADGTAVSSGYTTEPANGTTLNYVGTTQVSITYGGKSVTQDVTVGELSSISYNDVTFANTIYTEKEFFNPDGLVVTAHYSNSLDETVSAGDYTLTPNTSTALQTTDDNVEINFTWNSVEKTVNIPITVNAGSKYTVTFDAEAGECDTPSSTETAYRGGVTLPSATIDLNGWSFAGWATDAITNTNTKPTLYAAGSTYYPERNVTLHAVYCVEEVVEGTYKRATSVDEITSSNSIVIVSNRYSYVLNHSRQADVTAPLESNGIITPLDNQIFDFAGDNTSGFTIHGANGYLGVSGELPTSSSSKATAWVSLNHKWIVEKSTYNNLENVFVLRNAKSFTASLDYYNSSWQVYNVSGYLSNQNTALKIYVPAFYGVYNSNPTTAVVAPSVTFAKGNTTLYLDGTTTYTNAATVTGVEKTATYSSDNTSVATVDANGVVTAVGIGTTTIRASVAAELGVNTAASASYEVTVKTGTTIASIKNLTSDATEKSFTADLTDAVVTYVNGNYAYIQDASAAIGVNFSNHGLTAGQKINGAVSGTVKASNQIDMLIAFDKTNATVSNDGVIPAAQVKTLAEIKAAGTDYDGKLVTVNGVTVSKPSTTTNLTDGSKIDEVVVSFTMYSPNSAASANHQEQGNFTGFVSLLNGSTYRLNLYDQSQFDKTHNAPTAQTLTFASDAVELDEETDVYDNFAGQTVSGNNGTVTYAMTGDAIGTVNTSTGAVTLNGAYGTATITATAAAIEITTAGVTTPYTATTKSYTVTVYPRYTSTFHINGTATEVRQGSHGAAIEVPTPAAIGEYVFMGWKAESIDEPTNDAPTMVTPPTTPTGNVDYYAVYAKAIVGEDEDVELYKNTGSTGTDATSGITATGNINTTSSNGNPGNSFGLTSATNKTLTLTGIDLSSTKSANLIFDYKLAKSGSSYSSLTITQYSSSNSKLGSETTITGSDQTYHTTSTISLNKECVKITVECTPAGSTYNTFVDNIVINIVRPSIDYAAYTTSISEVTTTVTSAGYSTYVTPFDIDFTQTEGIKAYAVQESQVVGFVDLVTVNAAPQGTPLILRNEGTFTLKKATTTPAVISTLLKVAETNVDVVDGLYVLSREQVGEDYVVGFYAIDAIAIPQIPAGRVYLDLRGSNNVKAMMRFNFEEESTSIRLSTKDEGQNIIYDLQGRKVLNPVHGIYIVNGKKVFIK